jgi:plastocyanin/uncharacterized membrane protein
MSNIQTQKILLVLVVLFTGMLAGLFYGYACSVNPGLGRLSDQEYLKAMQSINSAILNPVFFLSFIGSLLLLPLVTWVIYTADRTPQFYFLLAATLIYFIGVFGVTVIGNVPLNEALAGFRVDGATAQELLLCRKKFELPWNKLHLVRTVASALAFLLSLLSVIYNQTRPILLIILMAALTLGASTEEPPKNNVHVVLIKGMKFVPKLLEIKPGETVRWINESGSSHNVVSNDGSFKSEMLDDNGEKFEYTFNKEGKFQYYCQPHRMMGMNGTLIVKK